MKTIKSAVAAAVDEINEADTRLIWRKVFSVCSASKSAASIDVADYRNSEEWQRHVIDQSTALLQQM